MVMYKIERRGGGGARGGGPKIVHKDRPAFLMNISVIDRDGGVQLLILFVHHSLVFSKIELVCFQNYDLLR